MLALLLPRSGLVQNHLWGAPRIHCELLKLGIAVSKRTVSRYLQGRPTARSQTWRTFFANHLGDLAFMPPVMSSSATGDDDVVDASGLSFHPVPLSRDGLCAANQWAVVDWSGSRRAPCLGQRFVKDYVHGRTGARTRTGRDPPQHLRLKVAARRPSRFFVQASIGLSDRQPRETIRAVARSRSAVPSLCPCAIESSTSPEGRNDFVRTPMSTSAGVIRTLAGILAKHSPRISGESMAPDHVNLWSLRSAQSTYRIDCGGFFAFCTRTDLGEVLWGLGSAQSK